MCGSFSITDAWRDPDRGVGLVAQQGADGALVGERCLRFFLEELDLGAGVPRGLDRLVAPGRADVAHADCKAVNAAFVEEGHRLIPSHAGVAAATNSVPDFGNEL